MILREKVIQANPMVPLGIGCLCTAAFIGLNRFVSGYGAVDFLSGMLCGLSVVVNGWGLWLFGRRNRAGR